MINYIFVVLAKSFKHCQNPEIEFTCVYMSLNDYRFTLSIQTIFSELGHVSANKQV